LPIAKKFDSEILFLHVERVTTAASKDKLKEVTLQIKRQIAYPKKSGYVYTDASVSSGIDYFLKHHKADCLAVFKRHRNVLQEIYRPSISRKVSLHATTPLLVIHEKGRRIED
jgi:hypothetical protein